jgi:hypothetical protein
MLSTGNPFEVVETENLGLEGASILPQAAVLFVCPLATENVRVCAKRTYPCSYKLPCNA